MLLHQRHEDDGEEGADVDELEDLAQTPGEGEAESDGEGEEDVAADGGDLVGAIVGGIGVVGLQGQRARSLVGRMCCNGCSHLDASGAQIGWLRDIGERKRCGAGVSAGGRD